MRAPLFSLLALLPLTAAAQQTWVESSATVALTLSHQSATTITPTSGGGTRQTTRLHRFRLGNREVLQALVAEGLIDSITGWKLVAVWDGVPSEPGPRPRYHAKRGKSSSTELVEVPAHLLALYPSQSVVAYKRTLNADDAISASTEKLEVLHQLAFDIAGHGGLVEGIGKGSGRFTAKNDIFYYLPGSSKTTLVGAYSDDGESVAGLVSGTLKVSAAKIITLPASSDSSVGFIVTPISPGPVSEPIHVNVGGAENNVLEYNAPPATDYSTGSGSGYSPMISAVPNELQYRSFLAEHLAQLQAAQTDQQTSP